MLLLTWGSTRELISHSLFGKDKIHQCQPKTESQQGHPKSGCQLRGPMRKNYQSLRNLYRRGGLSGTVARTQKHADIFLESKKAPS